MKILSLLKSNIVKCSLLALFSLSATPVHASVEVSACDCSYWEKFVVINFAGSSKNVLLMRVADIVSVSTHNYMLNGTIPMKELTVDMKGNNSIRIYCPTNGDDEEEDDYGSSSSKKISKVTKKFPDCTHAHSVEYCVTSPAILDKLQDVLLNSTVYEVGAKVTVQSAK